MRILQIHNQYRHPGGEDVVVERERADLTAAGHDVDQYVTANSGSLREQLRSVASAPWSRAEAGRVRDVIAAQRPDVVHVHNTWYRLSPSVIAEASDLGVATVHTLHNYRAVCIDAQLQRNGAPCEDCRTIGPSQALRHRCFHDSTPLSIVAAATRSRAERKGVWSTAVDRFIVMAEPTVDLFATWGFDRELFSVRPHRIPDPGPRLEQPHTSRDVLFVGRLEPPKGIIELCAAWSSRPRPFRLVVVGGGPLEAEVAELYPEVVLLGQLTTAETMRRMQTARALIFPSTWRETFGNVVAEAMASSTPAAVSSLVQIGTYVANVGPEWVFDVHRPEEWERILSLIEDDDIVDEAGKRSRAVYEANFATDSASSLLAIYEEAIEHRGQRSRT